MQKISLSLISVLFCVPLFHDLTTKDLQMAHFFLFDLVSPLFWARIFPSPDRAAVCLRFLLTQTPLMPFSLQ